MLIMSMDGAQFRCDAYSGLLTGGLALFKPLRGPTDTAECLTVHRGCTKSPIIQALLPRYRSRTLQQVMSQLDDTLVGRT